MNKLVSALHNATHRVPGVLEHQDRPRGHQRMIRHGRFVQNRPFERHHAPRPHHHTPPRLMVRWQNRIANLFAVKAE